MTFVDTSIAAWSGSIEISGIASFRKCHNGTSHTSCLRTSFPVLLRGDVSFMDCNSPDEGGAIWIGPYPTDRLAKLDPMYYVGPRSLTVEGNVSFRNCSCAGEGGAIFIDNSFVKDRLTIDDDGDGITDFINITASALFMDCTAGASGGAIWSNVPMTLSGNSTFERCTSFLGGAIYGSQEITINGSAKFRASRAGSNGGAIYAYNGSSVAVYGQASFSECSAKETGGAIFASATVKIAGDTSFLDCCASHGAILNVIAGDIFLSGTTSVGHSRECSESTETALMFLSSASPSGHGHRHRHGHNQFHASGWTLNKIPMLNEKIGILDVPVIGAKNVAKITLSNVLSNGYAHMLSAGGVTHGVALKNLSLKLCGSQCLNFSQIPLGGDMSNISMTCQPGEFPFATENQFTDEDEHVRLSSYNAGCQKCQQGTVSFWPSAAWCGSWQKDWVSYQSSRDFCMDCDGVLAKSAGNQVVDCSGSSLHSPRGVMVLVTDTMGPHLQAYDCATPRACPAFTSKALQAYRCPNPAACPGGDLSVKQNGSIQGIDSMCQGEYAYSPGCTSCRYPEAGRQKWNGLWCDTCGSPFVGWSLFVLQPLLVFSFAYFSAATRQSSRLSELFNIALSFGTFTSVAHSLTKSTEPYHDLSSWMRSVVGLPAKLVAIGPSPIYSNSLDCLYGTLSNNGAASVLLMLAMEAFMHAVICVGVLLAGAWKARRTPQAGSAVGFLTRNLLVLSNIALPNLTASLFMWTPCMKMSGADGDTMRMVYSPNDECNHLTSMFFGCSSLALFATVGPLTWWWLIKKHHSNQHEWEGHVGYLVYRYRAGRSWWSIIVLCRKTFLTCVAVLCPSSYASGSQLACLLFVFSASSLLQLCVQPYDESEEEHRRDRGLRSLSLNQVECVTLFASTFILILVASFIFPSWGRPRAIGAIIAVVIALIVACTAGALMFLTFWEFQDSGRLEEVQQTARRLAETARLRAEQCWLCIRCCCCRSSTIQPAASQFFSLTAEDVRTFRSCVSFNVVNVA